MKRPAFQFYPADWRKDSALQSCSLPARGLWWELICIMHECEPYGSLSINGKPIQLPQIARLVGETPETVQALLDELEEAGVFSRDPDRTIFSRRMRRDEYIRDVRAQAGKLGGNPSLLKQKDKQGDNLPPKQTGKQILTPSSSSSSSSSKKEITSEILRLSDSLAQGILSNNPKNRSLNNGKYKETVERWTADIDKLHRLDGQSIEDIQKVITWCQADPFWKKNILSGATLRKHWDRLYLAISETREIHRDIPEADNVLKKIQAAKRQAAEGENG
jgi:hypothetical protein